MVKALVIAIVLFGLAATPANAATTVWAVGDGADSGTQDDAIAAMIEQRNPDAFLYLGDVYEQGTAGEYAQHYATGYGRLKSITYPTPGNHEWDKRAEGYDAYWGARLHLAALLQLRPRRMAPDQPELRRGSRRRLGTARAGCAPISASAAATARSRSGTAPATRPRTNHGDEPSLRSVWGALAGRATIVLTAHDHSYQRFKPIDGITNWVVGSGGHGLYRSQRRRFPPRHTQHDRLRRAPPQPYEWPRRLHVRQLGRRSSRLGHRWL